LSGNAEHEVVRLRKENKRLKQRIKKLEKLLSDCEATKNRRDWYQEDNDVGPFTHWVRD